MGSGNQIKLTIAFFPSMGWILSLFVYRLKGTRRSFAKSHPQHVFLHLVRSVHYSLILAFIYLRAHVLDAFDLLSSGLERGEIVTLHVRVEESDVDMARDRIEQLFERMYANIERGLTCAPPLFTHVLRRAPR